LNPLEIKKQIKYTIINYALYPNQSKKQRKVELENFDINTWFDKFEKMPQDTDLME